MVVSTTTIRPRERQAIIDMHAVLEQAKGDHPAFAEVRRRTCLAIDSACDRLAGFVGRDAVDALLDEIEAAEMQS